ncbi:hypothetical protein Dsin_030564 [Dipteronia sinensis]|uniref:Uncharacterized protein n=1 Tax=Dipteronia sinensis TaxID=43782 RepID=A0AAD9ZJH3_9ROSI|nr:hypothetical protein Dsin_030564 [Dipteronia sinensis]
METDCSFTLASTNYRPATQYFTIHGLWPTDADGKALEKRVLPIANLSFLLDDDESTLVRDLNRYWPNFRIDNINKCFWKHEWDKHGCTISEWNEPGRTPEPVKPEDYFERAVTLINNDLSRNILSALKDIGLVPNNSCSYPVSNFISAITSITGPGTVMLNCTGTDNKVLGEVRLCVNRNATGFTKCSGEKEKNKTQNSCGDNGTLIRFPAS